MRTTTGWRSSFEVVSGVTPDDRYVVEALMNVRPGMTVKPVREKTKR